MSKPIVRVGMISNPRSYRNKGGSRLTEMPEAIVFNHEPASRHELRHVIEQFQADGVDMIVVNGGDGTLRDVMSAADAVYGGRLPRMAVIPSGKTNALAFDLGVPRDWRLSDAIRAHRENQVQTRSALRVHWNDGTLQDQLGFIFGFGVFNRATVLAQHVHKLGWFNGLAVVFTLIIALAKTCFGSGSNGWRRGDMVVISNPESENSARRLFIILGSTLRRMPVGLKPFGEVRDGLKFLIVDAPPKALHRHILAIVRGVKTSLLARHGYHRRDAESLTMQFRKGFILDGEQYPGGNITLSKSAPIEFVTPKQC